MKEQQTTGQPTLMAVYGTLKRGFGNNRALLERNSTFLGTHETPPNYTMYSAGGFPIVVDKGNTSIHCEIFAVEDPAVVERVNRLEGFVGPKGSPENWYDRQTIETPYGPAEIYLMHEQQPQERIVPTGNWK